MKKILFCVLTLTLFFTACKNAYKKEIGEVEGLINMVDELEKSILSVDTAKAFEAKRQIAKDLQRLEKIADTLDRETAFKLDGFYSGKKKLNRFSKNYYNLLEKINFSKKQLKNLKKDLNDGLISKEKFEEYYKTEQSSIIELTTIVNKSIVGVDEEAQKLKLNRSDIDKLFEELAQKTESNEE